MAGLSDSFIEIFDKATSRGHAQSCTDKWVVVEHEKSATMARLEIESQGAFLGFDHDLVKGATDITSNMSSKLDDKDCDGIAFFTDKSGNEHIVFAELKSGFDVGKITGAFHQITMSFVKMHAWLSLCRHYDLEKVKIHFITACKCFKGKDQEDNVMLRISQAQQMDKDSFEARLLKPLLQNHNIEIKMTTLGDIQKLPFNDVIGNKEVAMYLQLTDNPNDSQTRVNLA